MGTGLSKSLMVAAWCDPQARTCRLSWGGTLGGLLITGGERFVAAPSGVVVPALQPEPAPRWRRGEGFG
jgi:hypothetical protein